MSNTLISKQTILLAIIKQLAHPRISVIDWKCASSAVFLTLCVIKQFTFI